MNPMIRTLTTLSALLLSLVPITAQAQSLEVGIIDQVNISTTPGDLAESTSDEDRTVLIGQDGCVEGFTNNDAEIRIEYTTSSNNFDFGETSANNTPYINGLFRIRLPQSDTSGPPTCNDATSPECVELNSLLMRESESATVTIPFEDLVEPDSSSDEDGLESEEDCRVKEVENTYFIQLDVRDINDNNDPTEVAITLDTISPGQPSEIDVTATEDVIQVGFNSVDVDDLGGYRIVWSETEFPGNQNFEEIEGMRNRTRIITSTDINTITADVELTPGTQIWVGLTAFDEAGNDSLVTAPVRVEVTDTITFWEEYTRDRQIDTGFCAATAPTRAPMTPWAALAACAFAIGCIRRTRNR